MFFIIIISFVKLLNKIKCIYYSFLVSAAVFMLSEAPSCSHSPCSHLAISLHRDLPHHIIFLALHRMHLFFIHRDGVIS